MLQAENILPVGKLLKQWQDLPRRSPADLFPNHCVLHGDGSAVGIAYGHIPVGAVLLVRQSFDPGSKTVSAVQSFIFDDELLSVWSHVAIVGLGLRVWDIMPDMYVRQQSMGEFLQDVDLLAVRALKAVFFDPDDLESHIEELSGSSYPNLAEPRLVRAFLRIMAGKVVPSPFLPGEFVCSTFVDRVLRVASGIEILPDDRPPLALPGHFARSSAFIDVPMAGSAFTVA